MISLKPIEGRQESLDDQAKRLPDAGDVQGLRDLIVSWRGVIEVGRRSYGLDREPPPCRTVVASIDLSTVHRVSAQVLDVEATSNPANGGGVGLEAAGQLPEPGQAGEEDGVMASPDLGDHPTEADSGPEGVVTSCTERRD